jgi:hypothetical protein
MIAWESRKEAETEEFQRIASEIRAVGNPLSTKLKDSVPLLFPETRWNRDFKAWEYPRAFKWLNKLQESYDRPLRVMDFGCGFCPFPQFLANKGYNVWGVDNDSDEHIDMVGINNMINFYPDVHYFFGEIGDLDIPFDAIISLSVIEHVRESERSNVYWKMKELLGDKGKSFHIVDFYPGERTYRLHNRVNFVELAKTFGYSYDEALCPGSSQCKEIMSTEELRDLGVDLMFPDHNSSRILLADDV